MEPAVSLVMEGLRERRERRGRRGEGTWPARGKSPFRESTKQAAGRKGGREGIEGAFPSFSLPVRILGAGSCFCRAMGRLERPDRGLVLAQADSMQDTKVWDGLEVAAEGHSAGDQTSYKIQDTRYRKGFSGPEIHSPKYFYRAVGAVLRYDTTTLRADLLFFYCLSRRSGLGAKSFQPHAKSRPWRFCTCSTRQARGRQGGQHDLPGRRCRGRRATMERDLRLLADRLFCVDARPWTPFFFHFPVLGGPALRHLKQLIFFFFRQVDNALAV